MCGRAEEELQQSSDQQPDGQRCRQSSKTKCEPNSKSLLLYLLKNKGKLTVEITKEQQTVMQSLNRAHHNRGTDDT